jgi:hypothetical protein
MSSFNKKNTEEFSFERLRRIDRKSNNEEYVKFKKFFSYCQMNKELFIKIRFYSDFENKSQPMKFTIPNGTVTVHPD